MRSSLMFQGTGSDVGKSFIVAGLCRAALRRGISVAPFKPQNMSNNAAVTDDGGEIGRAQWVQAIAAGRKPSVHMNPVLLKPESDRRAQVIVQGKVWDTAEARDYQNRKRLLLSVVMESYETLKSDADLVLVEGAGSPAETNLRRGDIANMGFALAADVPVVLIGDIDRGGVIASIVGTHAVLEKSDRAQIVGTIINRFRGNISLFDDGIKDITARTNWPCFGVLPWLQTAHQLPAEDAVVLERSISDEKDRKLKIAVPMVSRIANFDDLDPLIAEKGVEVTFVPPGKPLPRDTDLIILAGTKSTLSDMQFLINQGWDIDIKAHVRQGGAVLGLCGGYQMLGHNLFDPDGADGDLTNQKGLGLLDIETRMVPEKTVRNLQGATEEGHSFDGYEIHVGQTDGADTNRPFVVIDGVPYGASAERKPIWGCYLHGLFSSDDFRASFLKRFSMAASSTRYRKTVDAALDDIAASFETHLDIEAMLEL